MIFSVGQAGPRTGGAVLAERQVALPGLRKGQRDDERHREIAIPGRGQEVAQYTQQIGQVSSRL